VLLGRARIEQRALLRRERREYRVDVGHAGSCRVSVRRRCERFGMGARHAESHPPAHYRGFGPQIVCLPILIDVLARF
jgi:hypothetical protein